MLLHHSVRHAAWHLRMAQGGIALRVGRLLSLLLVITALGVAIGHAILRRGAWLREDADIATDDT